LVSSKIKKREKKREKRERIKTEIKNKEKVSVSMGIELQLTWCSSESSVHHISLWLFCHHFPLNQQLGLVIHLDYYLILHHYFQIAHTLHFFTYPTQPHPKHLGADYRSLWHNCSSTTIAAPVPLFQGDKELVK
jgi:hypothetical protein